MHFNIKFIQFSDFFLLIIKCNNKKAYHKLDDKKTWQPILENKKSWILHISERNNSRGGRKTTKNVSFEPSNLIQ